VSLVDEKAARQDGAGEAPSWQLPIGLPSPYDGRRRWAGPWLACIWLVFLVPALVDGWHQRDHPRGIIGLIATLAFMVVYTSNFLAIRESRITIFLKPNVRHGAGYVGLLAALGVVTTLCVGVNGLATAVYVAVSAILLLPLAAAAPIVVLLVIGAPLWAHLEHWQGGGGVSLGTILGSFAVFGMRMAITRNLQLVQAYGENTRLAVDNERNRFARDLHDILGHSLTVITVKAELAGRLLESPDPAATERARAEVADLERLSRDALADVRRAVEGYRELTLPGELARARAALEAAQITPVLPQSTEDVPTELRELFAWTVREGVTNVIRHSGAHRCEIRLTPTSAEVRDDGRLGAVPTATCEGSGLTGLRERASAVGAVLTTRTLTPGFSLEVAVR